VSALTDPLRLAVGTLTAVPVTPPARVDPAVAARAMVLAPLVGAALGAVVALAVVVGGSLLPPLVLSVLAVATLAALTRAIHLDGLADTVDGLGSGQPGTSALAIMRRGDVGPFGVVAIVLVLALDIAALAHAISAGLGVSTLVLGCMLGRLALPLSCRRGVPTARSDGLGRTVVGTVPWVGVGAAVMAAAAVATLVSLTAATGHWLAVGAAAVLALGCGEMLLRLAVRRFGGLTGDVLGAITELATAVALVCLVAG